MPQHLLILGNSAAALSAVRAIRARGGDERITIVSKEACSAYSPVLTTYYLRGVIPEQQLYICDANHYRDLDCHFGMAAVELDADAQIVSFDDGTRMSFDALLMATGAAPQRLGADLDPEVAAEICYLRTIEDARRIKERADKARHVVVMGAGLVSLQVAAAIARPNVHVTCVVASRQVLSQNVDGECAALIRSHVERSANIEFLFGVSVSEITKAPGGFELTLDNGERLRADMLVAGKGVTPNVDYVDPAQIAVDAGIVVDDRMRTSAANVYAAGDLAQGTNRLSGKSELVANWIDACEQGRIAGANMAGGEVAFAGSVAENITTLFGAPVASIGITRSGRQGTELREVRYLDEARGVYRKLFMLGGRLVGAVLLRDIEDAGVLRSAIVSGGEVWPSAEAALRGHASHAERLRACLQGG